MRPRSRLPLLAVLALCAVAGPARNEERHSVAILPVVVRALEQPDYLRDGLADMLASRLGQQPGIGVIRVNDAALATVDPEAARSAGRGVGAQWVLFGSFTRFGEGASLDLRCLPVAAPGDPGPRSIFVQTGKLGELIPRLDGLAERVALHVTGKVAGPAGGRAGAADRSELEELRRRVEALERWANSAAAPASSAPAEPSSAAPEAP